ncbi:MAG: hypothetical protein ACRDQD_29485 [Nocardioidaceae bacterium]
MNAVTWQGVEDVRVEDVPDPHIEESTDAIMQISSTTICGSDLHLYRPLAMFMEPGDISATSRWVGCPRSGMRCTRSAPATGW